MFNSQFSSDWESVAPSDENWELNMDQIPESELDHLDEDDDQGVETE
jgi:hypothetical protein